MVRQAGSAGWPDLISTGAIYFSIGLVLEGEVLAAVRRGLGLSGESKQAVFVQHYTRSGGKHEAYGHLHESGAEVLCHVSFDLDVQRYPKGTRRFSELYKVLLATDANLLGHCTATFEHATERVQTVIPLPWRILEYDAAPFDEVRGFRLVKLDAEEQVQFSAIIDMRGTDKLALSVDFDFAGQFSDEYLAIAYTRAVEFASRLVRPKMRSSHDRSP